LCGKAGIRLVAFTLYDASGVLHMIGANCRCNQQLSGAAMHSCHLDNADLSRKCQAMEKIVSDLRLAAGLIVT
jgi:hypothetical protein